MANKLTTNPIVLDTAGATSAIAIPLGIQAIVWDNPGAAGAQCVLHDAAGGNVIWQCTAQAQYVGGRIEFPRALRVAGLYLTTLGSGTVLVYLE